MLHYVGEYNVVFTGLGTKNFSKNVIRERFTETNRYTIVGKEQRTSAVSSAG